jgi:hypothetical protein
MPIDDAAYHFDTPVGPITIHVREYRAKDWPLTIEATEPTRWFGQKSPVGCPRTVRAMSLRLGKHLPG